MAIRSRLFQTYTVVAIGGFAILAVVARSTPYFSWDIYLTRYLQSLTIPGFGPLMNAVSWPGFAPQSLVIVSLIISLLAISGLYWEAVASAVSFSVMTAMVTLVKTIVGRVRPAAALVTVSRNLSTGSFPSGHVVNYVVVLGFLMFLAYSSLKKSSWRTSLLVFFALAIALVGPSRIYQGEHWPSDVVGAYLFGTVWLLITILFYRWGKPRFFTSHHPIPITNKGS